MNFESYERSLINFKTSIDAALPFLTSPLFTLFVFVAFVVYYMFFAEKTLDTMHKLFANNIYNVIVFAVSIYVATRNTPVAVMMLFSYVLIINHIPSRAKKEYMNNIGKNPAMKFKGGIDFDCSCENTGCLCHMNIDDKKGQIFPFDLNVNVTPSTADMPR